MGSAIAIYFIIWWLVFFLILTTYDRRPDPDVVPGTDHGAPARPRMGRRVLITTVASLGVFAAFVAVLNSGLTLDDVPLPSPPGT